jgi:hypothetical protein
MGTRVKAQELRDLLSLARKLRDYAAQTGDANYASLFLATARSLEAHAWAIAYGTPPPDPAAPGPPAHIDLTC